jgi:hypothetical protein
MTPSQRYREKHKERLNAAAKQWRENNRERFLSTHRALRHTDEYKQREKARTVASRRSGSLKFSLQKARQRAKENGWEFDLDLVYLQDIWTGICPILNVPLSLGQETGTISELHQGSLDRLDSSRGYVKGNVHYISFRANNIKTDATFDEFEQIYLWWKEKRNE